MNVDRSGHSSFRAARRSAAVTAALVVMAAAVIPSAFGHAVIKPGESRPADLQQYTLTVPTERDSPTTQVELRVPEGITFFLVEQAPDWTTQAVRTNDRISEVRWTAGEIPPDHYAVFRFIARNPVQEGELVWPVIQRYGNGDVSRWIGPVDSEEPASRTTITESAVPDDVVNVTGDAASAGPASAAADGGSSGDSDRDGLTLAIAIVAAVAALVALGTSIVYGRRRSKPGGAQEA